MASGHAWLGTAVTSIHLLAFMHSHVVFPLASQLPTPALRLSFAELAARHHRAVLERAGPTGAPHSAFFLAEEATARGDVAEVERLMAPFLDTGGRDRERAKAVLR